MQEESGEPVCSDNDGGRAEWLCPLCQQGQPDRNSLSQHLTNQHNVLPTCLDKLLDIAVQKRCASGEDEDTDLQKAKDAATLEDLKHGEDSSSQPCRPDTESDAAQKPINKVMEEERDATAEQARGGAQPGQEGSQPPKQQNAAANVETQDSNERRTDTNAAAVENNARPFKCNACLENFPTKTALSVHYTSASHVQRMTTGSSKQPGGDGAPSVPVLSRPYISNKPYQCATCRVSYNHAITLESHMKSVLHQTRSRNAGNATSSAAAGASGASGNGLPLHTAAVTTVAATNCAAPGNLLLTAKDLEHIQASAAVVPSLLSSPVASAQAVSAFLTLLTAGPNSLSHALLPSVFAAGAAPGAAVSQLLPQPHMLMPLILNGLQAQNQQRPDGQPTQLMPHCVPLLGLNAAQQALLAQRLCSLQNQWPAVGLQAAAHAPRLEERKEGAMGAEEQVKREESDTVQGKSSVKREVTDSWTAESCETEREEDGKGFAQGLKTETKTLKVAKVGDAGKADGDSTTDQLGLDGVDKAASLNLSPLAADKSFRNNNLSPSASVPSNCSLSPVNLNLTLSPDSTPQKSQAGTSPCGSLGTPRSSPYKKRALISPERRRTTRVRHVSPGPPVLSDFQSEVLWAFFESRSEADAASPPREDCEALGREVGLHKDAVRRWLSHARLTKERQRALGLEHRHMAGDTRHTRVDNDYDEEESSLMIVEEEEDDEEDDDEEEEQEEEEEEDAEASSSQAMDLSSSRWKKREREVGRESQGDSCLTSDSENEEVYAAVVSDEESLNGSLREAPDSPVKEEVQRQPVGDKGLGGGKVLRSTTVFLSDAEDEDEEEEGAAGQRARRQKRKRAYEEVEIKKERQDPDVDLELEAQGDPPNTLALPINHPGLPSGILHSLPLSLSLGAFPAQFLSPYVLSLPPSMLADGSKLPPYPNPPNITRFPDPLCAQNLSSHGHASRYLSNGGDCESALDLSMGKNSHSKSASSSSSTSSSSLSLQKGRLLDGLGLRPTSKGLIVVQVKPEPGTTTPSNSSGMFNCNNMNKSSIYMRAAEKMNATLLEREKDKDKDQRKNKGKRYRDMRRSRTIIRAEQLDILYGCYFKDPNPGKHEFEQISEWVHLPKKVVQIWFQNMRARERKGEVRFISDGTLAAVGKPLIKFTWPLSKPLFSNKQSTNNTGSITATPIVRTLIKTEKDPVKEMGKPEVVKSLNKVPIKPKEVVPSTAVSLMSSNVSAVPKIKLENFTMVKIAPKINAPILPAPPKEPLPIAPRPTLKRKLEEESEEEKTDEEKDGEKEVTMGPGTINRMVPKLPTTPITPINNKSPVATAVSQKQNGLNYWAHKHKGPFKINTLSREQLALPAHTPPRTIPPPPTPSIAPVSPNTPVPVKALPPAPPPTTPALVKSIHTESSFLHHSTSRRPRTHLSCPQLSILQSCYETCAHPNAMECEAIGTELGLPLKVVQIWFQNTRAKEKRWRLQQEKVPPLSGEKVDMSSGSYLQYSALRANRPILPKPVQLTVIEPNAPPAAGQPAKELLTGRCKACNVTFESRAAARAHVFSPRHLATLRTTNFGQPATLVNKNGNGSSGAGAVSQVTPSSGGEAVAVASLPPPPSTTATSTS